MPSFVKFLKHFAESANPTELSEERVDDSVFLRRFFVNQQAGAKILRVFRHVSLQHDAALEVQ